jgi:Tn7-like transposition protein D/TniQ
MSGRAIAEQLTPLPYFSAFAEPHAWERAIEIMLSSGRGQNEAGDCRGLMSAMTSLGRGRGSLERRFKYCLECVDEDVQGGLPPYWRIAHQLPGVVVCCRHDCALLAVGCDNYWGGFSLAHALELASDEVLTIVPEKRGALLRIATASSELLDYRCPSPDIPAQVRTKLIEAGISDASGRVSSTKLVETLVDCFGEEYLGYVGFPIHDGLTPVRLRARTSRREPLNVLLLREAAFYAVDCRKWRVYVPTCPNPYASHGQDYPMSKRVTGTGEPGIYRWHCECGTSVAFAMDGNGVPENFRISRHGFAFHEKAQELLASGQPISEVAKLMGVDHNTIIRWSGKRPPRARSFGDVNALRKRYQEILTNAAFNSTISDLWPQHQRLIWQLKVLDGLWLRSTNREYAARRAQKFPRKHKPGVDWSQRDCNALEPLIGAAVRLATRVPPVRLTSAALRREAGIRVWSVDLMPQAAAYIRNTEESYAEFCERAVCVSARHLLVNTQKVSTSSLRQLVGKRPLQFIRKNNPRLLETLGR